MSILLRFLAAASTARLTSAPDPVLAQTANIDRLAHSGLLVRYAFGTTPQCSPSRISTLTGKTPTLSARKTCTRRCRTESGFYPPIFNRLTGVPFTSKIPSLRNVDLPPPEERWGRQGPT